MTSFAHSLERLSDAHLAAMTRRAWYRAARGYAEVREHCKQHGSGGHTELCIALGNSARSDDQYWHRLMTEQRRRQQQAALRN